MKNFGLNVLKSALLIVAATFVMPAQDLQASDQPGFEAGCPCNQKNRNEKQKNRNEKEKNKVESKHAHHKKHSHHSSSSRSYSYIKRVSQSGNPESGHRKS